jgi:peptidoglycan DL-endopeptidase CwlO
VASHLVKRSMRTAVAAAIAATLTAASVTPATAQPPTTTSEAAQQVQDLMHQAEQLTQDVKKAEDDHAAKQADLDRANADAAHAEQEANAARVTEDQYRSKVDALTNASYQGAQLNKLSALLTSQSPSEFLDRASTLDALAKDDHDAVTALSAALEQAQAADRQAQDAQARAAQAVADAMRIENDLHRKQADMQAQIARAQQRFNQLSAADKALLHGGGVTNYSVPPGTGPAAAAVQAALSRQGDAYVWGATGPTTFDCSGLTQWSYKQAGISIDRSTYSQVTDGRAVSASNLQPGDLIFYYSDNSHVAMYVGNGLAVHAPETGDVVKVMNYQSIGQVNAIRRIVG